MTEKKPEILRWFHYLHLPEHLQEQSKPFCELARWIVETIPDNDKRDTALRKLLEAKDAAIHASMGTSE